MNIKNMCAFSFGGQANFRKNYNVGEQFELDFSPHPIGIGFAIRDGEEADLSHAKQIKFTISSSTQLECIVEFRSSHFEEIPDRLQRIYPYVPLEEFCIEIPKLGFPLKGIVILFPEEDNPIWKEENVTISNVEIV